MVEQIFKSKNITVSVDMDPNNNDPHTFTIIEEHTSDKKAIIADLIDEVQKPYNFKLDWWMTFLITLNTSSAVLAIYNDHLSWLDIIALLLLLPCLYMSDKAQKSKYTSKALTLIFTILKVDGQI
jgi:hypothetical protein